MTARRRSILPVCSDGDDEDDSDDEYDDDEEGEDADEVAYDDDTLSARVRRRRLATGEQAVERECDS